MLRVPPGSCVASRADRQTDNLPPTVDSLLNYEWDVKTTSRGAANQHFDSPDDTDRKLNMLTFLPSEVIMLMHICPFNEEPERLINIPSSR